MLLQFQKIRIFFLHNVIFVKPVNSLKINILPLETYMWEEMKEKKFD